MARRRLRGVLTEQLVYNVVGRWLHREPAFLHEHEPEHQLEELALMTVSAEWLTRWQPISMHRALLAGATPGTGRRRGRDARYLATISALNSGVNDRRRRGCFRSMVSMMNILPPGQNP